MDKIDRLLDATEHPDHYSDKEIEGLLSDPEVREAYDLLDKLRATLSQIQTPDVDAEWDKFSNTPRVKRYRAYSISNLFGRNIAASIAISIASLAAVAAVVGLSVNYAQKQNERPEPTAAAKVEAAADTPSITVQGVEESHEAARETIVFDNEPLEAIVNRIADYYGYKTELSPDAKTLRLYFRWEPDRSLDEVMESLNNFDQIHLTVDDKTIKTD